MSAQQLDRRSLLRLAATILAGAPLSSLAAQETVLETAELPVGVEGLDPASVRTLGEQYLRDFAGDEAVVAALELRLRDGELADEAKLLQLQEEVKADYAADRTANLFGWFVSRTEGRLLAAIARALG